MSTPPGGPPYQPPHTWPPGAPVGYPPPAPKRPRPSAWWFVLPVLLLLLAAVSFPLLVVRAVDGLLDTDARVAADGRPHPVTLADTEPRLIWAEPGAFPDCRVTDAATGEDLVLDRPRGTMERTQDGRAERGWQRFDSVSTTVEVTCGGNGATAVSIGPMPDIGGFVGSTLAAIGVPLVLGGLGLIALLVLVILFATGGPRNSRT